MAALLVVGGVAVAYVLRSGTLPGGRSGPVSPPAVPLAASALEIPARPLPAPATDFSTDAKEVAALRDEAFDIAERAVRALPNNPDALCLLGSVHHRYCNEVAAVRLWKECLRINPRFADAHHSLGLRANAAGDYGTAELHLREAARIDPGWTDVPLPLAEALFGQGKFRETITVLEPVVGSLPQRDVGWCRLGQAYHQLEDFENARRCHEQAIAANPNFCDARQGAALACERLGMARESREQLEALRKLREAEIQTNWEQRASFTDLSRARKAAVQTCLTAARVYLLHGRGSEAEAHWRRVIQLDPHDRESRESLSQWLARQSRWAEAIPLRQEICNLEPANPRHWMSLGVLYGKNGQSAEAEGAFRRVVELAPEQGDGYAALAEIHLLPGRDVAEAIALGRKAVLLAPTARHHYVLATAYWSAGDPAAAREELERAIRLNPQEPEYQAAYARLANSQKP